MPAKLEEIEATYLGDRFRFDQCIIGEVQVPQNGKPSHVLTIKGDADDSELRHGQRYRFYGRFSNYTNRRSGESEKQFHFQTFVPAVAHDRESVVAYLVAAGSGLGVGPGTAGKAFDKWGSDCIAVIREDARKLMWINSRITPEQCDAIAAKLIQQQALEDATIDLTSLLSGRGFPKSTARNAIKAWGNKAAEKIRRDPYSLMAFRGCGFKLCDSLYLELGLNPARLRRQALCAWYSIASQSTGDIWYPATQVIHAIQATIGAASARPKAAIRMAMRLGRMSPDHYGALAGIKTDGISGPIDSDGKAVWLAEGRAATNEESLARMIVKAIDEAKPASTVTFEDREITWQEAVSVIQCRRCGRELMAPEVHVWDGKPFGPTCITHISDGTDVDVMLLRDWIESQPPQVRSAVLQTPKRIEISPFSLWPDPLTIKGIDDHQRERLSDALVSRVAILGGSPGTGKTYSVAMLIRSLLASGRVAPEDICIGAPTGKAAVRLSEALEAAGVPIRARTWHSHLGVGQDESRGGWSFQYNERNPWPFRIIIGDEWSMNDNSLSRAVFAARPRGAHMLMVGDVNQLPPVGAGAPLRDIIASGICGYGELTEIKRNSGGIVEACAAIRDGKPWEEGDNLTLIDATNETATAEILNLVEQVHLNGLDPVWDCQVIVAVNDKSELSRKKLNRILQHELNASPEMKGSPFRLHDKIVCLKNGKYPLSDKSADDAETYVANGELAEVIAVEPKRLVARLKIAGDEIIIPKGKSDGDDAATGCNWDLAYALTCHKLQGSEATVVIVVLDSYAGARRVCSREWLYTAISRAKVHCHLVGKRHIADSMCRQQAIGKRKTLLRERIQLEMSTKQMEGMF